MGDHVPITDADSTTRDIAVDTIATEDHQLVKVEFGADGTATQVSTAAPLPTTDAAVLAKLSGDPATQTTLAAVLAKLTADPATQTSLAAAVVELTAIAGSVDGLEAKLDTLHADVDGLEGKDFATQTTLAAVLAKLIAAPATEAKQDSAITLLTAIDGHVDGLEGKDYATQTTLAAVLAKIIAAPSTEAKQDALIALLPTALASGRLKTEATGSGTFTVERNTVTSATLANVASSASTVQLWASNSAARLRTIFNDSSAILYVKFGTTASTSDYTVQIAAGGYYELPNPLYTARVDGIWASANGNARLTEA